ncbi:MAG: hypothetical protein R3Y60_00560 [bacterium]
MAKNKKGNSFFEFIGMCINLGVGLVAIIAIFLPVFTISISIVGMVSSESVGMFDDGVNMGYIIPYLLIALSGLAGAGLLFKNKSGLIPSIVLTVVYIIGVVLIYVIDPIDLGVFGTLGASETNGFGPILLTIAGLVGAGVNGFLSFIKFK